MTAYNTRYLLSSSAGKYDLLDLRLKAGTLSLDEQNATVVGSAQTDFVYAGVGTNVDFTASGAGVDRLYLDGVLNDYTTSIDGSVLTLSRTVGQTTNTYKISTNSSDLVIFANGFANAADLVAASAGAQTTVLNAGETSLTSPNLSNVEGVNRVTLQTPGTVTATAGPVKLIVSGSTGVDSVYINAGAKADVTALGGSTDKIYFTGKWSDYTKTVAGSTLKFTRSINGQTEEVVVAAGTGVLNDLLIFTDGNIASGSAISRIQSNAFTSLSTAGGSTGAVAEKTPLASLASATLQHISNDSNIGTDFITNVQTQTVSGVYSGTLGVGDTIQVKVGGSWLNAQATPSVGGGGTFSLSGVSLSSGSNALAVQVKGAAGNTLAGTGLSVTYDNGVPTATLSIKAPDNEWVNANEASVRILVNTANLQQGDTIVLSKADGTQVGTATVSAADKLAGGTTISVAASDLAEGANVLHATLSDVAGNSSDTTGTSTVTVTKDTQIAQISIALATAQADGTPWADTIVNDLYLNAAETQVLLTVKGTQAKPLVEGDAIQLRKDNNNLGALHLVSALEAAANTVYLSVSKTDLGGVDGTYALSAQISDAAGNQAVTGVAQSIIVDTHAPAPLLEVSSTDGLGAPLSPSTLADRVVQTDEASIWLKVSDLTNVTGGAFQSGDVVTLQQQVNGSWVDLVDPSTGQAYTATVGVDGGDAYIQVARGALSSGNNLLHVTVVDHAHNSATSGNLSVYRVDDITLTNAAMVAGSATSVEVTSQIVLKASRTLDAAVAGKTITVVNDGNANAFGGEASTHSFTVNVDDTRYVTISGDTITIKPPFDFDFGNSYHIEVQAGAFSAVVTAPGGTTTLITAEVSASDHLNFSTVAVGADLASAVQGQSFANDGTLVNGKKWFSIDNTGSLDTPAALDLSGGDYALVFKDQSTAGGRDDQGSGVLVGGNGFNLAVSHFGAGDLIYADDQANDKTQLNQSAFAGITDVLDSGTHTYTVQFDPDGVTSGNPGTITIVGDVGNTLAGVRSQLNLSNTQFGVNVSALQRVSAGGANNSDLIIGANEDLYVKVSAANYGVGDSVTLVYLDGNGVEQTLNASATVGANDISAGFVTVHAAAADLSALPQWDSTGMGVSVFAKVTTAEGYITRSAPLGGADLLRYDTTAPSPTLAVDTRTDPTQDATLLDSESSVTLLVDAAQLQVGDVLVLQKFNINSYVDTTHTATVTEDDLANGGVVFTLDKSSDLGVNVGNYFFKVKSTDLAGNIGVSATALTLSIASETTISGSVGAGPVLAGNDLKVTAYDSNGNVLGADTTVDAVTGAYSLKILSSYLGPVLLRVTSTGTGNDYQDEATGSATDLDSNSLSAIAFPSTGLPVYINPLTDLAARAFTGGGTTITYSGNDGDIAQANLNIARAFLGQSVVTLATNIAPVFAIDTSGGDTSASANRLGLVLAALSEQANTLGSVNAAQAAAASQVNWGGDYTNTPSLAGAARQALLQAKLVETANLPSGGTPTLTTDELVILAPSAATLSSDQKTALLQTIVNGQASDFNNLSKLQAQVSTSVAQAKIETYAESGGTAPTVQDYQTAGYSAVNANNLYAVNAQVLAATGATASSSTQQASLVSAGIAARQSAIDTIQAFASSNGAAPAVQDYLLAGVVAENNAQSISGVSSANLAAVNASVKAGSLSATPSSAELQTLANTGISNYNIALLALNHYAADGVNNAAPSAAQLAIAGLDRLSDSQIANLTTAQVTALGAGGGLTQLSNSQIALLAGASIAHVPANVIANLRADQVHALSDAQLAALTSDQAAALSAAGAFLNLTGAQIAKLSAEAIDSVPTNVIDNLSSQQVAGLSNAQLAALTSDQAAQLGSRFLLNDLNNAQLAQLSAAAIDSVPPIVIARLTGAQLAALRNDQIAALTYDQVTAFVSSNALSSLDNSQIALLSNSAIAGVPFTRISQLSAIEVAALRNDQLFALNEFQVESLAALGSLNNLISTQIVQIRDIGFVPTTIITRLNASEVAGLSNNQLGALTSNQADAIAAAGGFANLTNAKIAQLSAAAIDSVPTDVIDNLSAQQVAALTNPQLAALTSNQADAIAAAGGFSNLTNDKIAQLSAAAIDSVPTDVIDNLSAQQVAALTDSQLAALTSAQADAIAAAGGFANLTNDQIAQLSAAAIDSVPTDVIDNLSAQQVAALTDSQLAALTSAQADAIAAVGGFANLTNAKIAQLSAAAIDSVPTSVIQGMAPDSLAALSVAQLGALTTTQVAAITGAQELALVQAGKFSSLVGDTTIDLTDGSVTALSTLSLSAADAAAAYASGGKPLKVLTNPGDTVQISGAFAFQGFSFDSAGYPYYRYTNGTGAAIEVNDINGAAPVLSTPVANPTLPYLQFVQGTAGNDTVSVSSPIRYQPLGGNNSFIGSAWADTVDLTLGSNTVDTGDGNDTININSGQRLAHLDGGAGIDTVFLLSPSGGVLDLTQLAVSDFSNIEAINLGNSSTANFNQTLRLDSAHVNNATNTLQVFGSASLSAAVQLVGNWTQIASSVQGQLSVGAGGSYNVWSLNGKTVLISTGATVSNNVDPASSLVDPAVATATSGNDTFDLTHSGVAATVSGGLGDDTYIVSSDGQIGSINDTGGTDTLKVYGLFGAVGSNFEAHASHLNLAALAGRVTGIDVIDLSSNSGSESIDISLRFLADNAAGQAVKVKSSGDVVNLVGAPGTWTRGANVTDAGTVYKVYTGSYAGANQSLWVQDGTRVNALGTSSTQDLSATTNSSADLQGTSANDTLTGVGGGFTSRFYINAFSAGADLAVATSSGINNFYNGDEATPANDTLTGGSGFENLLYNNATQGITVSVISSTANGLGGTVSGPTIGDDSFTGINGFSLGRGDDVFTTTVTGVAISSLAGFAGNDTLTLGNGGNTVDETSFNGAGADSINLGDGNDSLDAGNEFVVGNDTYIGGLGSDTASYSSEMKGIVFTFSANDTANGAATGVNFTALGLGIGTDTLQGFESVYGGFGNDVFNFAGTTRALTVRGNYGSDTIVLGSGADTVNEVSTFGAGSDSVDLGAGNDTINAGADGYDSNDTYIGGAGNDSLSYSIVAISAGITIIATGATVGGGVSGTARQNDSGAGTDTFSGFESFTGTNGNDLLDFSAVSGVDGITLLGGSGVDTLVSSRGNDVLEAGTTKGDTYRWLSFDISIGNGSNGGNGLDTISSGNFGTNKNAILESGEDVLDLKALFFSAPITTSNLSSYVQMSGSTLQIDRDGAGSTYGMTSLVTLTGVTLTNTDLQNLLTAGQLVFA